MSTVNIYDFTVPQLIHTMQATIKFLQIGEQYCKTNSIDPTKFTTASIHPDMKDLVFQVKNISRSAKGLPQYVLSQPAIPIDEVDTTFADFYTRLQKTIDILAANKREDYEGKENVEIELFGRKWTGVEYVNRLVLPNFYFHATTAYDILRAQGVDLGKVDFLGMRQ